MIATSIRVAFAVITVPLTRPVEAVAAGFDPTPPTEAVGSIIQLFQRYRVVGLGEIHRSAQFHRLLTRLVTAPGFREAVDDIVVEFGNARYQGLMDRYLAGESVPDDSLSLVWRNTTQLLVWDSPLYQQFFRLVRSENAAHRGGRQLRILLGDPPIDWDQVATAADFPRDYGYRDPDTYRILEAETLAKGRRALVIIGDHHLLRRDATTDFKPAAANRAGLGDALAQHHPGASYLIWTADGGPGRLQKPLAHWRSGTMMPVAGTPIGKASGGLLFGSVTIFRTVNGVRAPVQLSDADYPRVEELIDAVLYVGPGATFVHPSPTIYADRRYVAELRRRGQILGPVFGIDVEPILDSLVKVSESTKRP